MLVLAEVKKKWKVGWEMVGRYWKDKTRVVVG